MSTVNKRERGEREREREERVKKVISVRVVRE